MEKDQKCPYCDRVVDDGRANWTEDEEEVTCESCKKTYVVNAEYDFVGFDIKRICQRCGDELFDDEAEETNVCDECDYSINKEF